jgi:hypothetical protein
MTMQEIRRHQVYRLDRPHKLTFMNRLRRALRLRKVS